MAKKEHYFTQFENNKIYHIYNRTVDKKPLFLSTDNYIYFIKQFDKYLLSYVDILSYCLLDNHFHFIIQVKDLQDLITLQQKQDLTTFEKLPNLNDKQKSTHEIVSHQFKKFFQSYAMAFNKQQNRIGTLFQTPFKRVEVNNEEYLKELVCYIHTNPKKHKLVKDFRDWKWSSFSNFANATETKLLRKEILDYFDDFENFIFRHLEFAEKFN